MLNETGTNKKIQEHFSLRHKSKTRVCYACNGTGSSDVWLQVVYPTTDRKRRLAQV